MIARGHSLVVKTVKDVVSINKFKQSVKLFLLNQI